MRLLSAFVVGLIFGAGIAISGMINPAKVLNFFDIAGTWDPSLIFVMGGALITTFLGYRVVLHRPAPLLEDRFQLPTNTRIDRRLIGGAALFGLGWGIAGFCPGAALPALGSGKGEVFAFVVALLAGISVARMILAYRARVDATA
ncbi:MAG: permease [Rhodobacteraceae bacterium CG17_big_fil_post_rev_8_21_14_2_50_63_15]|nr:YeeE/YedE family protein [Roseovarius sp.]PIV77044.1 MAG: permease [Rhodobacteraceae bacterium CG17_big_fil_post_rev_8_21_14_2_50_63_15]